MAKPKLTLVDRFWSKVLKTETCWIWQAQLNTNGYGVFHYYKRTPTRSPQIYAHRLSWMFENGQLPNGFEICHRCDNPACVNPDHLFLGTHEQNMADCKIKGRQQRGERHALAKLTDDAIRQIRVDPRSSFEICHDFGVKPGAIRKVRQGIRWKHIV